MVVRPLLALVLALAAPQPAARILAGTHPCGAVATAGAVWVANDGGGTVARIDPGTNRVTRRIAVGRGVCEVAAGFGALWVASYETGSLLRVDLQTHRVRRVRVGAQPFDVIVAGGRVWTTVWGAGTLAEVDPVALRVVRRIPVGGRPTGLLFRDGSLWVGFGRNETRVAQVDPATGRVLRRVETGAKAPSHFLSVAGAIWVVNDGDTIVRFDPKSGAVLGTTHLGRTLVQPAAAPDGTIWVPDKEIDAIFRVDPATGRLVDTLPGSDGAFTALRAFGSMWVTGYAGTEVWRFRP